MRTETHMGMNRTGAAMSPVDVKAMQEMADSMGATESTQTLAQLRGMAVAEADSVGSVPVPGSVRGAVKTGMAKLQGKKPEVLIDKLGERLAFERTGTRLYEAMITKCQQLAPAMGDGQLLEPLNRICREEMEHFGLLSDALVSLGADPTAQTPCADVTAVMSSGLMQVVTDPRTNLAQSLNAMLVAELADNASWELLIKLAGEAGHDELVPGFQHALQEESEHLQTIRSLLEQSVSRELDGDGQSPI